MTLAIASALAGIPGANYSGANTGVQSAGLVGAVDQTEAVASAQREGRMGLSQFALVKIPREVLFLQDERGAKIKSSNVSSSTKSDMDEDRLLAKVEDPRHAIDGIGGQGHGGTDSGSDQPAPDQGFADFMQSAPKETHIIPSGLLGQGAPVYQGVLAAISASLAGRNLSVLA